MMAISVQSVFDRAMALHLQRSEEQFGGATMIAFPVIPAGYAAVGTPLPLSNDREGLWTVFAHNLQYDALGMLTYSDDSQVVNFLTSDETLRFLFGTLDSLMDLVADCSTQLSDDHMREFYALWQTWSHVQSHSEDHRICVCCWKEANPGIKFPDEESSSLCTRHKHLQQPVQRKEVAS